MPDVTTVTVIKDLTPTLAKRLSARIADQVVKLDANQADLRKLLVSFSDGNGWKAMGYKKWEDWAKKVMPQSRSMLFRQLAAGKHEKALGMDIGSAPESHLRTLGKVPVEKRKDVFDAAVKAAEKADRPMQAKDVVEAAAVVTQPKVTGAKAVAAITPLDAVGVEIPDGLLKVFGNARAPFDEAMRVLSQLKTLVTDMVEGEASHYIGGQTAELEQERMNMFHSIKFGRPFAVCPYCKGQKQSCKACGDTKTGENPVGWVNELIWRESPVGKKAAVKAKATAKAE